MATVRRRPTTTVQRPYAHRRLWGGRRTAVTGVEQPQLELARDGRHRPEFVIARAFLLQERQSPYARMWGASSGRVAKLDDLSLQTTDN